MSRPRFRGASPHARSTLMATAGAVLLAIHASHEASALQRFSDLPAWRLDAETTPGLIDRVRGVAARVAAGRPDAPEASAAAGSNWVQAGSGGYWIVDDIAIVVVDGALAPKGYFDWWDERWVPGYADIAAALAAARHDDRVVATVLIIDSPGGLVSGCDQLCAEIRALSAREGGKPIVAFCEMAYSAAQWIAASCDASYAQRGAGMGSIGVRMGFFELSAMLEQDGVKREEFVSGRLKDAGSGYRPVTDEERALFQSEIDAHAEFFFDGVAAGRGLSADAVRSWEARCFVAGATGDLDPEAAGLIDGVLTESEALEAARALAAMSAGGPTGRPASGDEPAAGKKETDMSAEAEIAALRAKASRGDKKAAKRLASMGIPVAMPKKGRARAEREEEDTASEDDDEEEAEEEDDEPEAEEDDENSAAEEDDETASEDDDDEEAEEDDEPKSKAAAGRKIARIAADQGKPKLGGQLAADVAAGETSYRSAMRTLRAAGREGSPLSAAMSKGRRGLSARKPRSDDPQADRMKGLSGAVDREIARTARKPGF